jgi:hypothetical protein
VRAGWIVVCGCSYSHSGGEDEDEQAFLVAAEGRVRTKGVKKNGPRRYGGVRFENGRWTLGGTTAATTVNQQ